MTREEYKRLQKREVDHMLNLRKSYQRCDHRGGVINYKQVYKTEIGVSLLILKEARRKIV